MVTGNFARNVVGESVRLCARSPPEGLVVKIPRTTPWGCRSTHYSRDCLFHLGFIFLDIIIADYYWTLQTSRSCNTYGTSTCHSEIKTKMSFSLRNFPYTFVQNVMLIYLEVGYSTRLSITSYNWLPRLIFFFNN